jgi:hypothetical protein
LHRDRLQCCGMEHRGGNTSEKKSPQRHGIQPY